MRAGTPGWWRGHRHLETRKKKPPPLQAVGLTRFLGTDLGPWMGLMLWEVLMPWGAAWGRQLSLCLGAV